MKRKSTSRRCPRYSVETGRDIYRDGKPFIMVVRPRESAISPHEADKAAHKIAKLLNKSCAR